MVWKEITMSCSLISYIAFMCNYFYDLFLIDIKYSILTINPGIKLIVLSLDTVLSIRLILNLINYIINLKKILTIHVVI